MSFWAALIALNPRGRADVVSVRRAGVLPIKCSGIHCCSICSPVRGSPLPYPTLA